jgi:transposase InsO family protein
MRPSTPGDRDDRLTRHESLESHVPGKLASVVRWGADRKGPSLGGTSLAAYPTLRGLRHVLSVLREFVGYYNAERPHRTLGLQTPEPRLLPTTGPIRSRPVLNGLHHAYERAA